jgi:chromosome condensin MukBEF MukE localization factor
MVSRSRASEAPIRHGTTGGALDEAVEALRLVRDGEASER